MNIVHLLDVILSFGIRYNQEMERELVDLHEKNRTLETEKKVIISYTIESQFTQTYN